ncbi:MAG TPA: AMIN domain-containing protein, partial [Candidatus Acidoferrales bacterium]|nr:AMIN domain-containing protein [Candidatus Acidoferrales bacterium]
MKNSRQAYWVAALILATVVSMIPLRGMAAPGPSARVVRVEASVSEGAVRIEARASAPFDFTTYRPSDSLFILDMSGVVPADAGLARVLKSSIVSSYRVLPFRGGEKSMVRLEVILRPEAAGIEPQIERIAPDHMALVFAMPGVGQLVPAKMTQPVSQPAKPPAAMLNNPATAIEQVRVLRAEKSAEVRIEGNGRLACEVTRLASPDRVVLDFTGVSGLKAEKSVASSIQPVKAVRSGRYKTNVVRVVIDLDRNESHRVRAQGNVVTVAFDSGLTSQKQEAPAPPVQAAPSKTEEVAAPVSTEPAPPKPEPAPIQTAHMTAIPVAGPINTEKLPLPETLTQPSAALASPAPTKVQPVISDEPKAAPPAAPAPQARTSQAEPISVNLKDVDLKDFFRLIHEISGLNVVVDPDVKGTVTLVLDDV